MFQAVPLPIIRSLLTVHLALVYVVRFEDNFRAGPALLGNCLQTVRHIPVPSVELIDS